MNTILGWQDKMVEARVGLLDIMKGLQGYFLSSSR